MVEGLVEDLRRDEGVRAKPYRDTRGFLTIGVGHNLDAKGLCEAAIDAQLTYDIQEVVDAIYPALPWLQTAPHNVQRVILNMTFNLGIDGMLKWPRWLKVVEEGRYQEAAAWLLKTTYAKQVKGRAVRLAALLTSVGHE